MQTRKQFELKCREVAEQLLPQLVAESLKLYDSGGVDPNDFVNDYMLPRMALRVSLERKAELVMPERVLKFNKLTGTLDNLRKM